MLYTASSQPQFTADIDLPFIEAVLAGLSQLTKTLPCRYFYDDRGSDLFEMISELPEYYLTRSEAQLIRSNSQEIMAGLRPQDVILEFGAGSSRKMDPLLTQAPSGVTFVPIDVSQHALVSARSRLEANVPGIVVRPIVDDFSALRALPSDLGRKDIRAFFLGSTIGNFDPPTATRLLGRWKQMLGLRAQLIVGADVLKDPETLLDAYNDAAGVTKQFNLNILARINREIGRDAFDLSSFEHSAIFNTELSRVEMHLISRSPQVVRICDRTFRFDAGESIHTENSYKHSPAAFRRIVEAAGWTQHCVWSDRLFSLYRLA